MTQPSNGNDLSKVTVYIDPDLEEIVPRFLENRRNDAAALASAIQGNDLKTVRLLGHRMKGDGGGYGFQEISRIGEVLEQAALREDREVMTQQTAALASFLAQVEVVYRR
jgi:HPt (histidine-containing phosphotransfer) domain-containing protein